eukprot:11225615-Lingulodinium_polyedra.AAC.1
MALLKELVWEAGGNHVKWVFYGTPAAGNGVLGVLEMGCSAICLCEDAHHKEHFLKALEQKAVENFLLGSSNVFGDADLLAKAQKYVPRPEPKKKDKKDDKEDKKEGNGDKEDKKEGKKTSKNKQRSSDDTSDEDEKNKTKKKKKAKKTASGAPKKEQKKKEKETQKAAGEDSDSEDTATGRSADLDVRATWRANLSGCFSPRSCAWQGRLWDGAGRGHAAFPEITSRAECERMRALALAPTCLPHGAVVVYLMSSDVPRLWPGCLVSSPLGKQAFQLSQGAGFFGGSVSHEPAMHLPRTIPSGTRSVHGAGGCVES